MGLGQGLNWLYPPSCYTNQYKLKKHDLIISYNVHSAQQWLQVHFIIPDTKYISKSLSYYGTKMEFESSALAAIWFSKIAK